MSLVLVNMDESELITNTENRHEDSTPGDTNLERSEEDIETRGILEMIERIRNRRLLFDSQHPLHMDRNMLKKAWKEVAEGLIIGSEVKNGDWCKQKWKKLKDYYGRKKKIITGKSGDGRPARMTWPYYTAIRELMKTCQNENEETISNLDSPPRTPEVQSITGNEVMNQSSGIDQNSAVASQAESLSTPVLKKKKRHNESDELTSRLLSLYETQSKEEDEEFHFGMSIASRLRKLSPRSNRKAQLKINEVLFDVEFPVDED